MTSKASPPIRTATIRDGNNSYPLRLPALPSMDRMVREILSGETYPVYEQANDPSTTIVDIGANIGAASLFFLLRLPQAQLFAFEPVAESYALLRENLQPFPQARTVHVGLFSRDTVMDLYGGKLDCTQNSVSANLETGDVCGQITLRRASAEFRRLGIERVNLMKIDTEGCEVPILEDLADWLPRIDQIYVEYHSEEDRLALDALLAAGFLLCRSRCDGPHRGTNLYVARRVIEADPRTALVRLSRPA